MGADTAGRGLSRVCCWVWRLAVAAPDPHPAARPTFLPGIIFIVRRLGLLLAVGPAAVDLERDSQALVNRPAGGSAAAVVPLHNVHHRLAALVALLAMVLDVPLHIRSVNHAQLPLEQDGGSRGAQWAAA